MKRYFHDLFIMLFLLHATLTIQAAPPAVQEWLPPSLSYDYVEPFIHGHAIVESEGKYGIVDRFGNETVPLHYDRLSTSSDDGYYYTATKGAYQGVITAFGDVIAECVFDSVRSAMAEDRMAVSLDGLWGFIDSSGTIVIPPLYEEVGTFHHGHVGVRLNGLWGSIDRFGNSIIPCSYAYLSGSPYDPDRDLLVARKKADGKMGLLTTTGDEILPFVYDRIGFFSEGLAWAQKEGMIGCISSEGKTVIPFFFSAETYSVVGVFSQGVSVLATIDDGCGLIDAQGKIIVPLDHYEKIERQVTEGAMIAMKDDLWACLDTSGQISKDNYDFIGTFHEGYARARAGEKWFIIDQSGRKLAPLADDRSTGIGQLSDAFHTGLAVVCKDNAYGVVDTKGKLLLPFRYEEIQHFNKDGYAWAKRDGLWGILRHTAHEAPAPTVKGAFTLQGEPFEKFEYYRGYAVVEKDGKQGLMNRAGQMVIPTAYEEVQYIYPDVCIPVRQGRYYGAYSPNAEPLLAVVYDAVQVHFDGSLIYWQDDQAHLMNDRDPSSIDLPSGHKFAAWSSAPGMYSVSASAQNSSASWGIIDDRAREIVAQVYDSAVPYNHHVVVVEQQDKFIFLDTRRDSHRVLCECDGVDTVAGFFDGLAWVRQGDRWGCVDSNGTLALPYLYEKDPQEIHLFSQGYVVAYDGEKYGTLDRSGNVLVPFEYDEIIRPFLEEGWLAVRQGQRWGYVDQLGEVRVPLDNDAALQFSEHRALVCKDKQWSVIDASGDRVSELSDLDLSSPPKLGSFRNGVLRVQRDNKLGLIDRQGQIVLPIEYDDISYPYDGAVALRKGSLWSLYDLQVTP